MIGKYKPNSIDADIIEQITGRISAGLEGWYGSGAGLNASSPEIHSHRNSFMLRYSITDSGAQNKHILVKIRRTPKMTSLYQAIQADIHQKMPAEFKSLKVVHDQFSPMDRNFCAIRPLTYIDQYAAIVMEEYPSRTLRQLLNSHRFSNEKGILHEMRDASRKSGLWLRYFHDHIHTPVEMPYKTEDILQEVQAYGEQIESCSQGRVRARPLLCAFTEKLKNIPIEWMVFSQTHTDMTCDNVLFSEDRRVCVTDIKTRPAPIYEDLGLLLVHPETFKTQIFSAGTYYSKNILHQYRSEILEGYFNEEQFNQGLVSVYAAVKVLDKWLMYEGLMNRYKGLKRFLCLPVAPLVSAYFQNLLNKYLRTFVLIAAMLQIVDEGL